MIDKIDNTTKLQAFIDIDDPEILITDAGFPKINGKNIRIEAYAHLVTFISPPSCELQEFSYDLENLDPGEYTVTYAINDRVEAELNFEVCGEGKPLPNLISVRTGETEFEWYSKIAVALLPGQQIVDWGTLRRSGKELHLEILVDNLDHEGPVPVDPIHPGEIPDGVQKISEGNYQVGGSLVRLVSHLYPLGKLSEGNYELFVHSRGNLLTSLPFEVDGIPPQVVLITKNIAEAKEHHRFKINFQSVIGLDIDSIRSAKVWVTGPDNYREEATHESFSISNDTQTRSANGSYSIRGPGGHWDHLANGEYQISIEAEKILDEEGNALEAPHLGDFKVDMIAQARSGTD